MLLDGFDVVIVGAGFFGATIAERVASELGRKVCVLDRRTHIGGNAYSETDPDSGIEVHRYGTHIFHTNSETVWRYLRRFTEFTDYRHRVLTVAQERLYSMPINLATVSAAFGRVMAPQQVFRRPLRGHAGRRLHRDLPPHAQTSEHRSPAGCRL
jgi:UDP-galactopyranose mutase